MKLAGAVLGSFGLLGGSAVAAAGPPPPPTAVGGQTVTQVAAGLHTPTAFAFGGGKVFEADGSPDNGGVFLLSGGTGTKLAGSPKFVAGLAWYKGALYLSGGTPTGKTAASWTLQKWSGFNGTTFAKRTVLYTAPKGFQGFNGIAFGPDGRLYVGADVGLLNNNDHGPAKTPYVYSILSLKPNGKDLKVFATGIRQPWQLAFPSGSSSPLVSDLGQDSGAKNPPDFVLRVRLGDNYGFPKCNRTAASKCKGFTQPFRAFAPHTNIMGMAIIGKTLYMTSFLGSTGKAGEVFSMPLTGGPLKPVVTGFVAPTVGLGTNGRSLYIGELTGQVFSVTP
ncbi:MAG: PQQ-dependent sugar dehydrogenase [Solirubrobacteraceae bacterium]